VLDHFYTFNKSNGRIYRFENKHAKGIYTVFSDAELSDILKTGSEIVFTGTLNGR
jgi:hypothetical protein